MLRQNPHNVDEWHKRVALFEGDPERMVKCYTESVKTVDNAQAVGRPHTLWLAFARMYVILPVGHARCALWQAVGGLFLQKAVSYSSTWVGVTGTKIPGR